MFEIWSRDAEGTQPATRLFSDVSAARHSLPLAVSPDGTMLAFLQTAASEEARTSGCCRSPAVRRVPLVQGPFDDSAASFSPDSTLVAFQSAETGRWEIYVQRLHDGRRIVVSTDGGERPIWARDGLYFQSRGQLVRATVADDAATLRVGQRHRTSRRSGRNAAGRFP